MIATIKAAWKFIRFDKTKSIGVVVGIVISSFLIGQQIGIFFYLQSLMSVLVNNSSADIWVVDNRTKDANQLSVLDVRKEKQIKSLPAVAEAHPMIVSGAQAKFADGTSANVSVIGSEYPFFKAGPDSSLVLEGAVNNLNEEAGVSAEFFDRGNFGGSAAVGTSFEINGKRAVVKVQTKGVRGWGGYIMYTTLDRARYYGNISSNNVSAILVKVKPGVRVEDTIAQINQNIYGVKAWKKEDFQQATITSVLSTSGLGTSTGTMVGFAIIAGFFIIGLTMYSSALDRIKDYGTLKAIGATNGYIRKLILTQATLFATVGFLLALFLLFGFEKGVSEGGLLVHFTPAMIGFVMVVTFFTSIFSAIFAIKRIKNVEPASVFRG